MPDLAGRGNTWGRSKMRTRAARAPDPRQQPTLATVAGAAGVSPATVSRVVNGLATVAPQYRRAVEEAIERLGYVPNRAARSLVTRRTGIVAFVVREPVEFGVSDPYVSSLIVAVSQCLAETGGQLMVLMAQDDKAHTSAGEYVRAGHVDGALLVSLHADDPLPQQMLRARVPVVVSGRPPMDLEGLTYVDVDNCGGGRLAAQRLIDQGRVRIATIAGPADMSAAQDRLEGFKATASDAGLNRNRVVHGEFTRASGEQAMVELLAKHPDLDGVFAASDAMALGALRALRRSGRSVPGDVAVVGFDDIEAAMYAEPSLTTIRQPVGDEARVMVASVLQQIRGGGTPDPTTLPASLVIRDSG